MKLSALIQPLIAAKVPHEQIMAVVLAFEAEQGNALEQRRKADAERQARKRQRGAVSRDVTVRHSDRSLTGEPAHVEDKTSNLEIEPQKKETVSKRAARLPEDWTLPTEWRVDAIKASLPERLIDLEAAKMRDWSRSAPKGAKTEWRPAWRNWCREAAGRLGNQRAGPLQGKASPIDHFRNYASELNGQDRDDRGPSGNRNDAPGVPVRTIEHHR